MPQTVVSNLNINSKDFNELMAQTELIENMPIKSGNENSMWNLYLSAIAEFLNVPIIFSFSRESLDNLIFPKNGNKNEFALVTTTGHVTTLYYDAATKTKYVVDNGFYESIKVVESIKTYQYINLRDYFTYNTSRWASFCGPTALSLAYLWNKRGGNLDFLFEKISSENKRRIFSVMNFLKVTGLKEGIDTKNFHIFQILEKIYYNDPVFLRKKEKDLIISLLGEINTLYFNYPGYRSMIQQCQIKELSSTLFSDYEIDNSKNLKAMTLELLLSGQYNETIQFAGDRDYSSILEIHTKGDKAKKPITEIQTLYNILNLGKSRIPEYNLNIYRQNNPEPYLDKYREAIQNNNTESLKQITKPSKKEQLKWFLELLNNLVQKVKEYKEQYEGKYDNICDDPENFYTERLENSRGTYQYVKYYYDNYDNYRKILQNAITNGTSEGLIKIKSFLSYLLKSETIVNFSHKTSHGSNVSDIQYRIYLSPENRAKVNELQQLLTSSEEKENSLRAISLQKEDVVPIKKTYHYNSLKPSFPTIPVKLKENNGYNQQNNITLPVTQLRNMNTITPELRSVDEYLRRRY